MENALFDDLLQSLKEVKDIAKGKTRPVHTTTLQASDVKAIREKTGLSQSEFARLMRVRIKTLQNWEQHRRQPTGPAAALLKIVSSEPEIAIQALHA